MKKVYGQLEALNIIKRMEHGESIEVISKETGIGKTTLWRWREGKSFPQKNYVTYQEWYEDNRKEVIERVKMNRYGGLYFTILQRDNNQCQICYVTARLHIHHIDGNKKNNIEDNLITLCVKCHRLVHLASFIESSLVPWTRIAKLAKRIIR